MSGEQVIRQGEESGLLFSDGSQGTGSHTGEDGQIAPDAVGGAVAVLAQTSSSNTGIEELGAHAAGSLLSIASGGKDEACSAPLPSGFHVPIIGHPATLQESSTDLNFAIKGAIESSPGGSVTFVSDVADAIAVGTTEDIEDKAKALMLARLRSTLFAYASKLPIVGSYFSDTRSVGDPDIDTLATETTPLLGSLRDPGGFATKQAEGLLHYLLSPMLNRLPDAEMLDNTNSGDHGRSFRAFVECYVLAKDGGGWLFTHLQEHSLVIAPTVSLGHLSTTNLAASTIGMAVASVTGYSIIQGFISSLDKVLVNAPNPRVAKIACAQAAVVTGIVLFPITNLWSVQSTTFLQRLGQSPEVAGRASEFLQIAAAGLPGYAIGEIAKRYLTSQGLSNVHTRILSATAPVNLILNYLLVDGPIPALRLGFSGAPLCTVLSHNALAIMLIIYIVQRTIREEVEYLRRLNIVPDEPVSVGRSPGHPTGDNGVAEPSQDRSKAPFLTGLGSLVFAGLPRVLKSASQLWSKDFGGVVASILGPDALATQAILLTTATTLYQAPRAMSNVSSDRIKKWLSKGDVQRAKIAASVALLATLGGSIVIGNILLAAAASWGQLFNSDPVILQNVSALLPVIAIFQAVHGIGAWVDSALGALGKTAVFPALNASADYFLGIPLGVYLALPREWGLAGLWTGLTVSLAYSCLVATIVLVRTNWENATEKGECSPRGEEGENQSTVEPRGSGIVV